MFALFTIFLLNLVFLLVNATLWSDSTSNSTAGNKVMFRINNNIIEQSLCFAMEMLYCEYFKKTYIIRFMVPISVKLFKIAIFSVLSIFYEYNFFYVWFTDKS